MAGQRSVESVSRTLGQDLRLDFALLGGFFEDADLGSDRPGSASYAPVWPQPPSRVRSAGGC